MATVSISRIQVSDKRRPLRDVEPLMQSIKELGLLNPITVTPDFQLIAGLHRLEACKRLGWSEIEATVCQLEGLRAELAEIDENLARNELTQLERGEQLARRKEIYEALYPDTKSVNERGGPGRGNKNHGHDVRGFRAFNPMIELASDYVEEAVAFYSGGQKNNRNFPGYDIVLPSGEKWEVKYAYVTTDRGSKKYSISNVKPSGEYDFLVCLCWDKEERDFNVHDATAYKIPRNYVQDHCTGSGHIYIRLGGDGYKHNWKQFEFDLLSLNASRPPSFSVNAAAQTNQSPRTIRRAVKIATDIPEDVRDEIRDTPLADNQKELLTLSRMPEPQQREVVKRVLSGEARSVTHAKKQEASESAITAAVKESKSTITVYAGDAVEVLKSLPLKSFDLLLSDPPYNTGRMEWDTWPTEKAFIDWTRDWITACLPLLKAEYNAFVFCSPQNASDIEIDVLRPLGLRPKSRIVWNHRNMSMGRDVSDRFINTYDVILHFGSRELNWPTKWDDRRFDVQTYAAPQTNFNDTKIHQTQKPIELIKLLCEVGSYPADNVLDPFSGSGTTGAACLELGRHCTMIDSVFADMSAKRVGVEVCRAA